MSNPARPSQTLGAEQREDGRTDQRNRRDWRERLAPQEAGARGRTTLRRGRDGSWQVIDSSE